MAVADFAVATSLFCAGFVSVSFARSSIFFSDARFNLLIIEMDAVGKFWAGVDFLLLLPLLPAIRFCTNSPCLLRNSYQN